MEKEDYSKFRNQVLLIILAGAISTFSLLARGYFVLKTEQDNSKDRIEKCEGNIENLEGNTLKKDDFRDFKSELFTRLEKIGDKLDNLYKPKGE